MPDNNKMIQFAQNLTDLSEKRGADCGDGFLCWVNTQQAYYICRKTTPPSLPVADGLTVVASLDGTCVWLQYGIDQDVFLNQATWYIDATNGSDDNDGTSILTPLKTIGEYARRVRGGRIEVSQTVNVAFDTYSENIDLDLWTAEGVTVTFRGGRTPLLSSTLTAVQDWDYATTTQGIYTDAALPVGWAASGLLNKLIEFNDNIPGAWSWVGIPTGGNPKAARTAPAVSPTLFDNVEPPVGTSYTVYDLTTIDGTLTLNTRSDSGGQSLLMQYFEIAPTSSPYSIRQIHGNTQFNACSFASTSGISIIAGFLTAFACQHRAVVTARGGGVAVISGGRFTDLLFASTGGAVSIDFRTLGEAGAGLQASTLGFLEIVFTDYWVGIFDSTVSRGVYAANNASMSLAASVWGSGNTGDYGLFVDSGCTVTYEGTQPPEVAGFTNDTRVGATVGAYATLPVVDTNKLAAAVTF